MELESASGKQLKKAKLILSSIVFSLIKEPPGFEEIAVLLDDTINNLSITEACMLRTRTATRSLTRLSNIGNAKVLTSTAVTAVLLPLYCVDTRSMSCQYFCDMIGINCKSKYVKLGIETRKL